MVPGGSENSPDEEDEHGILGVDRGGANRRMACRSGDEGWRLRGLDRYRSRHLGRDSWRLDLWRAWNLARRRTDWIHDRRIHRGRNSGLDYPLVQESLSLVKKGRYCDAARFPASDLPLGPGALAASAAVERAVARNRALRAIYRPRVPGSGQCPHVARQPAGARSAGRSTGLS